jgi:predicted Zn-dependent peptidase
MGIFSFAGFPGSKYPSLYLIFSMPNSGHTNDEILTAIDEEIEKIKNDSITEDELLSAKTRLKVSLIRQLKSNRGLLMGLLQSETILGSWKKTFDELEAIEKVTTDDIKNLVEKYLTTSNRSIGRIEKKKEVTK